MGHYLMKQKLSSNMLQLSSSILRQLPQKRELLMHSVIIIVLLYEYACRAVINTNLNSTPQSREYSNLLFVGN